MKSIIYVPTSMICKRITRKSGLSSNRRQNARAKASN